jgi:hypothetical protein
MAVDKSFTLGKYNERLKFSARSSTAAGRAHLLETETHVSMAAIPLRQSRRALAEGQCANGQELVGMTGPDDITAIGKRTDRYPKPSSIHIR